MRRVGGGTIEEEKEKGKTKKRKTGPLRRQQKTPESPSQRPGLPSGPGGKKAKRNGGMLKSSPALDGFHLILKMKSRVAGGGWSGGGAL